MHHFLIRHSRQHAILTVHRALPNTLHHPQRRLFSHSRPYQPTQQPPHTEAPLYKLPSSTLSQEVPIEAQIVEETIPPQLTQSGAVPRPSRFPAPSKFDQILDSIDPIIKNAEDTIISKVNIIHAQYLVFYAKYTSIRTQIISLQTNTIDKIKSTRNTFHTQYNTAKTTLFETFPLLPLLTPPTSRAQFHLQKAQIIKIITKNITNNSIYKQYYPIFIKIYNNFPIKPKFSNKLYYTLFFAYFYYLYNKNRDQPPESPFQINPNIYKYLHLQSFERNTPYSISLNTYYDVISQDQSDTLIDPQEFAIRYKQDLETTQNIILKHIVIAQYIESPLRYMLHQLSALKLFLDKNPEANQRIIAGFGSESKDCVDLLSDDGESGMKTGNFRRNQKKLQSCTISNRMVDDIILLEATIDDFLQNTAYLLSKYRHLSDNNIYNENRLELELVHNIFPSIIQRATDYRSELFNNIEKYPINSQKHQLLIKFDQTPSIKNLNQLHDDIALSYSLILTPKLLLKYFNTKNVFIFSLLNDNWFNAVKKATFYNFKPLISFWLSLSAAQREPVPIITSELFQKHCLDPNTNRLLGSNLVDSINPDISVENFLKQASIPAVKGHILQLIQSPPTLHESTISLNSLSLSPQEELDLIDDALPGVVVNLLHIPSMISTLSPDIVRDKSFVLSHFTPQPVIPLASPLSNIRFNMEPIQFPSFPPIHSGIKGNNTNQFPITIPRNFIQEYKQSESYLYATNTEIVDTYSPLNKLPIAEPIFFEKIQKPTDFRKKTFGLKE